ncbi:MAG: hypothetical protein KDA41_17580, partial [Planctomycetales bacterium]|nr:hypothetical protein [Planctomycetales bacterium]
MHRLAALLVWSSACAGGSAALCASALADDAFTVPTGAASVLQHNCIECHGPDASEGDVRFDTLADLELDARLELLNKAHEQLYFGKMPPADAEQPSETERAELVGWVVKELNKHHASRLEDKLRKPDYGNYVDHEKLFSGQYADLKGFTYDRRWLISEFIFDAKFNRLLNINPTRDIDGKRQSVIGDNNRGFTRVNLTNPFLLPTNTGVRYYAEETLGGGHLLTMMTNAKEASGYLVYLTSRDKRHLPAVAEVMALEWDHARILAAREKFLNDFIDRILQDLYQDQHEGLLPKFVPVDVKPPEATADGQIKKAPFHAANPGMQELELIFRTMQKHQEEGQSDAQLIEKCQREWFNFGHHERKIEARVT